MYGCNIRSKSDEDDKDNVVVFVLLIKVQRKLDRVRGANEEELVREVLPPWADSINIQLLGEKIFSQDLPDAEKRIIQSFSQVVGK